MTERRAVRSTYDRIAAHFAETRTHPWPEVAEFLADRTAAVGLDIGCGNGRHLPLVAAAADHVVGLDISRALLAIARDRADGTDLDFVQADAVGLPVVADAVDLAVYVATLHHLPSRGLRRRSLDELARVLAPHGVALVSAWSIAHDRFDADRGFDTTIDWTLPSGETVGRYYHIYDPDEFDADLGASELAVDDAWVSSGNCYAVVRPG